MTPKEALQGIKQRINYALHKPENVDTPERQQRRIDKSAKQINIIEQTIAEFERLKERDTPMKPLIDKLDLWDEHRCPVCKSVVWEVHVHRDENFCNNCGQKLDWSEL